MLGGEQGRRYAKLCSNADQKGIGLAGQRHAGEEALVFVLKLFLPGKVHPLCPFCWRALPQALQQAIHVAPKVPRITKGVDADRPKEVTDSP